MMFTNTYPIQFELGKFKIFNFVSSLGIKASKSL